MAVLLAPGPFGAGGQFFDANGKMLNAGLINTYAAGTTTPLATYTTSTGNVANALSITLGVDGRPPNEIWFTAGSAYRLDLLDSLSNLIKTYDNLTSINDITGIGEWIATNLTPVFISATSFSLTGNQTTILPNDIRIKTANTSGTIYSTVVSGTYASIPNTTTFVVANDFGTVLDSGLSSVSYSILSPVNPSIDADMVNRKASLVTSAGVTDIWSIAGDLLHVTGGTVTSITGFGTSFFAGNQRTIVADASLSIINSASITTPLATNISAVAGDIIEIRANTVTNALVTNFQRAASLNVFTTGDVKLTLKTAADTGWVLMNDTTIGNGASGATGRANADTVALFALLWNNTADAQCAVSTGRGASAAADYAANKTIALPLALGRALATFGTGAGLTARVLAFTTGTETQTVNTLGNPTAGAASSNAIQGATFSIMQPTVFLNTMIKL